MKQNTENWIWKQAWSQGKLLIIAIIFLLLWLKCPFIQAPFSGHILWFFSLVLFCFVFSNLSHSNLKELEWRRPLPLCFSGSPTWLHTETIWESLNSTEASFSVIPSPSEILIYWLWDTLGLRSLISLQVILWGSNLVHG